MTEPAGQMSFDVLPRLRGYYPSLSPSEKKVADYILLNFDQVISMTLADLAHGCGVSDATAVRFCRSIGCQSFLELKLALTRAIPDSPKLIHGDIEINDPPGEIARKVFQGSIQAIEDTMAVFDENAFHQAVNMLAKAEHILIVGVGTSSPMAHEFGNRLFRLRMKCEVETDSYLQLMKAALLTECDVMVVISQTGGSIDPVRTASEAKIRKCPIICITGNGLSKVAELSDVVLLSVSHETRPETIASRVAQHTLIQALYVALAMRSVKKTNEAENTIWEAVMRQPPFQSG